MADIANQTTIDVAEPAMVGSEAYSSGIRAVGALVKVYKYTGDMPVDATPCADGSIVIDDGIPSYNIPFFIWCIISRTPPIEVAHTGIPKFILSIIVLPKGSGFFDVWI